MSTQDNYKQVSDLISSKLAQDVCPWHRKWSAVQHAPRNFESGHVYNGVNFLLLTLYGFESPFFMTFRQVSQRGGRVKQGSRGIPIYFWKALQVADKYGRTNPDGSEKLARVPFMQRYTVFNAIQVTGVEFPDLQTRRCDFTPDEQAEAIVKNYAGGPEIRHGFLKAAYSPRTDVIEMPSPEHFSSRGDYYKTLFHELGHATGAVNRLARDLVSDSTSPKYWREELIAELTGAFLCAHCGLDCDLDNAASYCAHWLKELENDPTLFPWACGRAVKAMKHILGEASEEDQPRTGEGVEVEAMAA